MLQKNILILIFLFLSGLVYAQNKNSLPAEAGSWVLDKTVNKVEFYHMITQCNGKNVVFLKLANKNNYKVKVSWEENFATQFEKKVKGFAGKKQLFLSAGQSLSNECNSIKFSEGHILSEQVNPTYIAEIKSFEYSEVKVGKIL